MPNISESDIFHNRSDELAGAKLCCRSAARPSSPQARAPRSAPPTPLGAVRPIGRYAQNSCNCIRILDGHTGFVRSLAFSAIIASQSPPPGIERCASGTSKPASCFRLARWDHPRVGCAKQECLSAHRSCLGRGHRSLRKGFRGTLKRGGERGLVSRSTAYYFLR